MDVTPIPSQIAIINAVSNPKYRFICAALSRRQGKTYIANILGQLVSLVPGCNILVVSPNYNLSQISFELQRQLIKTFDIEVARDNAKDKVIELINGSTIRMGSTSRIDSCVGRSYDLIIFDEAALTENGEEAFNIALRPTLDKPESKALFISTPRGRNNWFSRFYNRGFSPEYPAWFSIRATYLDNPRMSPADIEEARASMSRAEFEQEYMANFNTYEGQIWNFSESDIISSVSAEGLEIFAGLDIGFRDPTACCVCGYSPSDDIVYVLDEYWDAEKTTNKHASELRRLIDKWDIEVIFIDSAAQQTRFDLAQTYDIATTNATKSVTDGIGYVGSLVDNNRVKVMSECTEVLYSLDAYQWDPNVNLIKEKPKHDRSSHMADALRYGIYSYVYGQGIM